MSTPLKIKGIRASKHKSAQFAELSLFLLKENNKGQKVYTFIKCKLNFVNSLKVNILIDNNILASKSFVLNVGLCYALVQTCGVKITIKAKHRGQFLKNRLFAEKNKVVSPHSEAMIPLMPVPLSDNENFLFHPTAKA